MTSLPVDATTPNDPLSQVLFFGNAFKADMRANLQTAEFDSSTDQVTQIEFSFIDPGLRLSNAGLFRPKVPVSFEDYALEVSGTSIDSQTNDVEKVTVRCRPRSVRALKNRKGRKVMKNVSPSTFVIQECKAVGLKYVVQPSAKRKQVARDVKSTAKNREYDNDPSSWTTFNRLAGELGFICFESAGVLYFGKPTWLMKRTQSNPLRLNWKVGDRSLWPIKVPTAEKSLDSKNVTITFEMPVSFARSAIVGRAALVSGLPGFDGYYLITGVNYSLINSTSITVTVSTPEDPEKITVPKRRSSGGGSSSPGDTTRGGTGSAADFVAFALSQTGKKYVFGAEASLSDSSPNAFDCSELVEWAAHRAGCYMPDGSGAQINYCIAKGREISVASAIKTRGALLYKPGHIAISLGNGRTIEAVGTGLGVRQMSATDRSFRWTAAAKIPGMRY